MPTASSQPVAVPRVSKAMPKSEYRELFTRKPVATVPASQRFGRRAHDVELMPVSAAAIPTAHTHRHALRTSVPLSSVLHVPPTPDVSAIRPQTERSMTTAVPATARTHPTQYLRSHSAGRKPRSAAGAAAAGLAPSQHHARRTPSGGCARHQAHHDGLGTAAAADFSLVGAPTAAAVRRARSAGAGPRSTTRSAPPPLDAPPPPSHIVMANVTRRKRTAAQTPPVDTAQLLAMIDDIRQLVVAQQRQQRHRPAAPVAAPLAITADGKRKLRAQQTLAATATLDPAAHQRHRDPYAATTAAMPDADVYGATSSAQHLRDSIAERIAANAAAEATLAAVDVPTAASHSRGAAKRSGRRGIDPAELLALEEDYWRHSQAVLDELDRKLHEF